MKIATLTQYNNNIYFLLFKDTWDAALHFLRAQEYYECPNKDFQNKKFKLLDYIEWQAKDNENEFTYATDWSGFNIPDHILEKIYCAGRHESNKYDLFMKNVVRVIKRNSKKPFYLIGTSSESKFDALDHEIAHGLWHVNQSYREIQEANVYSLTDKAYARICNNLRSMGYADNTLNDEVHAYFATELIQPVVKGLVKKNMIARRKEFISAFKTFRKDMKKNGIVNLNCKGKILHD